MKSPILIICMMSSFQIFAQDYFPLSLGNTWYYKQSYWDAGKMIYTEDTLKFCIVDTLSYVGKVYYKTQPNFFWSEEAILCDSSGVYAMPRGENPNSLLFDFSMDQGSEIDFNEESDFWDKLYTGRGFDTSFTYLGIEDSVIRFSYSDCCNYGGVVLHKKFGPILRSIGWDQAGTEEFSLLACVIDGKVYGEIPEKFKTINPDLFEIGNTWTYNYSYKENMWTINRSDTLSFEVADDTTMQNGLSYAMVRLPLINGEGFFRITDQGVFAYSNRENKDYLYLDFYAEIGFTEIWERNLDGDPMSWFERYNDFYTDVFGSRDTLITNSYYGLFGGQQIFFSKQFGFVSIDISGDGTSATSSFQLIGARINGQKYGEVVSVKENFFYPTELTLHQNYPNPFNPVTKIKYSIPRSHGNNPDINKKVLLKIYDVLGSEIETLVNEAKAAGIYEVEFDASPFPSGVYFANILYGNESQSIKLILIK
ncbi:MAG: T9SS type A sorting domain-containing protein [Melioribacteraceae bacterium]|nr:T9SS type A sorting domain-containing protein [Melioribacteraceae bacterium]MCF8263212.1 T9SS type A sorting domain-containing protein [Melioribacteraceae bacterium]